MSDVVRRLKVAASRARGGASAAEQAARGGGVGGVQEAASSSAMPTSANSAAFPPHWPLPDLETASGCFETMRVYRGRIFRLAGHLDRLWGSARFLGVEIPMTPAELGRRLTEAVDAAGLAEAIARVVLIPGAGSTASPERLGHVGSRRAEPSIVVAPVSLPAPELYARGIRVAIVPARKFPVAQIDPQAKYSARLGSILAVQDAQLRGVDEAIFLDAPTSSVTESTASNLGIIKGGTFYAPPCWLGLLAGITWQTVIEAAARIDLPVRETPLTRHDLYNADEAFLLSSIKEVLPVREIDGRVIGGGGPWPLAARLHRAFRQIVDEETGAAR
jgi:branched-chain amino acid aminotransferase